MGKTGVDQGNTGFAFFAKLVAQTGDQFQTAGSAADHDYVMKVFHNVSDL